jgi:hypothetical protein
MALNLRAKIPASDTLVVRDVNENTMWRFMKETKKCINGNMVAVEVATNAREVAEKSVSENYMYAHTPGGQYYHCGYQFSCKHAPVVFV